MKTTVASLLAAMSFSVGLAQGAEDGPSYTIVGTGTTACSDYVKNSAISRTVGVWMDGYLSGFNLLYMSRGQTVDFSDGTTPDSRALWMDSWCRAHPFDIVGKGMEYMVVELGRKKGVMGN